MSLQPFHKWIAGLSLSLWPFCKGIAIFSNVCGRLVLAMRSFHQVGVRFRHIWTHKQGSNTEQYGFIGKTKGLKYAWPLCLLPSLPYRVQNGQRHHCVTINEWEGNGDWVNKVLTTWWGEEGAGWNEKGMVKKWNAKLIMQQHKIEGALGWPSSTLLWIKQKPECGRSTYQI